VGVLAGSFLTLVRPFFYLNEMTRSSPALFEEKKDNWLLGKDPPDWVLFYKTPGHPCLYILYTPCTYLNQSTIHANFDQYAISF